jgi:hypothetical protein
MSAALQLYTPPAEAPDDMTRARLIADAFDALEARSGSMRGHSIRTALRRAARKPRREPISRRLAPPSGQVADPAAAHSARHRP